jgi:phosphoglucomutase
MWAVIIAGGSGTRLWPLSRELFPKQLIKIGDRKISLFQETIKRVLTIIPAKRLVIVTHQAQANDIKCQLEEIQVKDAILIKEPLALNTAPAIGLAATYIYKNDGPAAIMIVLPSDHLLSPQEKFTALLAHAKQAAANHGLITFGIQPTYPETGYGYICRGKQLADEVFAVEKFVEKPNLALAKEYLKDSRFLWNSGMFVFKTGDLIEAYQKYLPDLAGALKSVEYNDFSNLTEIYQKQKNISIDYGIMEKAKNVVVIPTDITWSDVGSWEALYQISPKDNEGNYCHGRVINIDTQNSLLYSPSRLLSTIGVKDLVVVDTADALLVCARNQSQQVKTLVDLLKEKGAAEYIAHTTEYRPWGNFTVLEDQEHYKIKRIVVNPGKRLSLQSHKHRAEHWLVVTGQALVTIDTEEKLLNEGEAVFIPVQARHRLKNPGKEKLEIIEVQRGDYLGEDDIIRYEDDYGRIEKKQKEPFQIYNDWLQSEVVDAKSKQELLKIKSNLTKIKELFNSELSFGTGGLRGIIGVGLNRMNTYVVRKTTQGLANYLNKQYPAARQLKVAIAYDTRLYSQEFAEETALVLAANGIQALIFPSPRPTPHLSFTIRELKCAAGIVITASHNPPQYNGYKVYGPDGAQAVSPFVDELTQAIAQVDIFKDVRTMSRRDAEIKGLLTVLDSEIDQCYLEKVASLAQSKPQQKIKVVFTPLHGTGLCFIPTLLKQTGFVDLFLVNEQMKADPKFSTVKVPNPEDIDSFTLALKLAKQKAADLIIASDPDCDRLGCAVKDEKDDYHFLTGNQIGALMLEYLLSCLQAKNKLPANGVLIKTIVTGDLGKKIAASYGIKTMETLTGFKYIGEKIKEFETEGSFEFLFGYEESYGYLVDTFVRDKDANIAALLLAEMVAYYQERGLNLLQVLEKLFQRYGYFQEDLISIELQDEKTITKIMAVLEEQPPIVPGLQAVEKRNYQQSKSYNLLTGEEHSLALPASKVLYYRFNDDSWFCFRPSGTEPKAKFYFSVVAKSKQEAANKLANLKKSVLSVTKI